MKKTIRIPLGTWEARGRVTARFREVSSEVLYMMDGDRLVLEYSFDIEGAELVRVSDAPVARQRDRRLLLV